MEPIESASANNSASPNSVAPTTAAPSASSTSTSTPDDRATTFKAVQGGGETVPGGKLLIAAYAVVWIIVLLLVMRVFRRQNAVEASVRALEGAIRKAAPAKASSAVAKKDDLS